MPEISLLPTINQAPETRPSPTGATAPRPSLHPVLEQLSGGDRRSIGAANQVAAATLAEPEILAVLFQGMASHDPVLRMRCADAAEKVTAERPDWLSPFKTLLLQTLVHHEQQEIRWHVAPMLARLPLTESESISVLGVLCDYMGDPSAIVRTMAMQAMADLAARYPALKREIAGLIGASAQNGTPAVKARARKLLAQLQGSRDTK